MTDQQRALIYLFGCLTAAERVEELHEKIYRASVEVREEVAKQLQAVQQGDADAIADAIREILEGQQ
jgi:hypothetical protein